MIDTKRLDPDIFLESEDPDEIVFSILAGVDLIKDVTGLTKEQILAIDI